MITGKFDMKSKLFVLISGFFWHILTLIIGRSHLKCAMPCGVEAHCGQLQPMVVAC